MILSRLSLLKQSEKQRKKEDKSNHFRPSTRYSFLLRFTWIGSVHKNRKKSKYTKRKKKIVSFFLYWWEKKKKKKEPDRAHINCELLFPIFAWIKESNVTPFLYYSLYTFLMENIKTCSQKNLRKKKCNNFVNVGTLFQRKWIFLFLVHVACISKASHLGQEAPHVQVNKREREKGFINRN